MSLRFRTTYEDAMAIKAVSQGTANEGQQKRAVEAVVIRLCGSARDNFDANANVMSYLVGRESVAKEIEQYMIQDSKSLEEWFARRRKEESQKSDTKPL